MINPRIRNAEGCIFRENFINSAYVFDNGITLYGMPVVGNGLTLNGTTKYAALNEQWKYSFGDGANDSAFSVEASFIMTDATNFCVLSKGVYNTDDEWRLLITAADKINWQMFDESVADCYIGRAYNTALTAYEGQLIHVVATYDGSGTAAGCKIYLNGVQIDDTDASNNSGSYVAMEKQGHVVQIGRDASLYANGQIQKVAIYNRELTSGEVADLVEDKTFREIDVRQLEFFLPLRTHYNNGISELTPNLGIVGEDTLKWGDGSTSTTYPTLLKNNGASFDGGDYITVASPLNIENTGNIVLGSLFRCTFTDARYLWDVRNVSSQGVGVYMNTGLINAFTDTGVGTTVTSAKTYNDNLWHSLFVNYIPTAGSTKIEIYVDGVLDGTGTVTAFTNASAITVVATRFSYDNSFIGSIKFPFLWRINLNPTQVKWQHEVLFRQINL